MQRFSCLAERFLRQSSAQSNAHFADKLSALRTEFTRRFGDFEAQKKNFELLRNPFAVDVETAPVQIQMELIELQCNGTLKAK
ncbi:general transcription factor II-I repeat domain-containing protein 2-like protein [Lates japonicus]|uniref:General transcription factor II-I repeat domain-containing protein 2-like protein n=1 Tax=Lates japonicus TaxID=270547 RepID=A0AAD3N0W1_LATJO|nr:general transcription factor II-I repeat domain-containing protein 2-like protein [Lates japonicus]